ncbi:MAG: hypothetical protein J5J00_02890 [Deltaproteobacteria bacterium]|nr:hypothetical protein [Deltaproteobacteria bacterium]
MSDTQLSTSYPVDLDPGKFSHPPAGDWENLEGYYGITLTGQASLCMPSRGKEPYLHILLHAEAADSSKGWADVMKLFRLLPWMIHSRYMDALSGGWSEDMEIAVKPIVAREGSINIILQPPQGCSEHLVPPDHRSNGEAPRRRPSAIS